MAYSIQAILAKAGVLRPAPLPHLKIVNLKHGIDMVPLATPTQKHFGIPFCPLTDDEHAELPQELAELCRQFSRHGMIAYIRLKYLEERVHRHTSSSTEVQRLAPQLCHSLPSTRHCAPLASKLPECLMNLRPWASGSTAILTSGQSDKSAMTGYGPIADLRRCPLFRRCWGNSGRYRESSSARDRRRSRLLDTMPSRPSWQICWKATARRSAD